MKVYDKPYREDPHNQIISASRQGFYLTIGQRGSGKSATQSLFLTELFEKGWTVFDTWSAGLEAMFYCVNMSCNEKRQKKIDELEHKLRVASLRDDTRRVSALKEKLHDVKNELTCRCHKRYPITVLCSAAIEIDRLTLDKINGIYYTKEEWVAKMRERGETIIEYDDRDPPVKPEFERGVEWIRIVKLPFVKKTDDAKENREMLRMFEKALLESRTQRRILVYVPSLFPDDFSRYKTLALILTELPEVMRKHFKPKTKEEVGLPKRYWRPEDRHYHRLAVLMRELAEIAPQDMKSNEFAHLTKRSCISLVLLSRHGRITLLADVQRTEDVFKKVRAQSNTIIMKRTPLKMLGEELFFVKEWIDKQHEKAFKTIRVRDQESLDDLYSKYPPLQKLNYNYCYAVYSDDWIQKWKIPSTHHHHKQEDDDLTKMIGFDYKVNWDVIHRAKAGKSGVSSQYDDATNELIVFIDDALSMLKGKAKKGKIWEEIRLMIVKEQENGRFSSFDSFKDKTKDAVRMLHVRYKDKNTPKKHVQTIPTITS